MLGRAALRRTGCLAIVAIVVIGLAGCDWPLDRFDAGRTANNPLSGLSTSNVSHLGIAWSAATGGGALIVNGLVLTARADTPGHTGTEALSVSDGSVRWTSDVSVEAVDGGVGYGVRNDLTPGYVLFAVALDTGQTLWSGASQLNTGSVVSAGDGRVYVQTTNGSGHGTMPEMDVWNTSTHQLAWTKLNPLYPLLPAIANGIVYFAENVGEVLDAVDETTGAQRWSTTQQPSCPALTTSPVVSDGYLFWGGATYKANDGTLVAQWPRQFCSTIYYAAFAVAGTTIYAEGPATSSNTADIVAFDGITGALHWSYDGVRTAGHPGLSVIPSPIVANDVVFVDVSAGPNTLDVATIGFNTTTGQPVALVAGGAVSVGDGALIREHGTLDALRPE